MSEFNCCFSSVISPPSRSLHQTLPHSPKWDECNYKNYDRQPDEEFSKEKREAFDRGLLKLIKYPIEKHFIKKFDTHPDGPITTYLQWRVIYKRRKLSLTSQRS
jgi:hypothetical protein